MIIGLASLRPQVGKTTISDYLIKNHGFVSVEMSDPVVYIAKKYFGYNGNKHDPEQRKILQHIGYAGKQINSTIWLYYALMGFYSRPQNDYMNYEDWSAIKKRANNGFNHDLRNEKIIVSGIRSPFEAEEIKKIGGQVWLIKRDDDNVNESFQHKVENELIGYDGFFHIVENNSTFEDLYKKIDEILLL